MIRAWLNALAVPSFHQGGAGFYTSTLLDGLSRHPDVDVLALLSPELERERESLAPRAAARVGTAARRPRPLRALNYALAGRDPARLDPGFRIDATGSPQVVHWPISFMHAPRAPRGAAKVVTLHDLQHEFFPEFFSLGDRLLRRLRWRPSALAADHVIVVSEFTRRTVCERYDLPPERVTSVPNACREAFLSGPGTGDPPLPAAIPSAEPWVLYPASPLPAKNHRRLLEALALHRARGGAARLVLTGPRMHDWAPVRAAVTELGLQAAVVDLGHVDDGTLRTLYRAAHGLIFPSLFEGFGLPVLEAMASGCPVACSNAGSLPEVAGDAARQFDPEQVEDMAAAIDWLAVLDAREREGVASAGRAQAQRFAPQRMIDRTVDVYRALVAA